MAKKKTQGFLPKKIAGVRVPKKVRKGRFGELLASQSGQKLIAEAILGAGAVAAGAIAARDPDVKRKASKIKHQALDAGDHATHDMSSAGAAFAYALNEAARSFSEALRRGQGGEARSFAASDEAPEWTGYTEPPQPAGKTSGKQSPAQDKSPL